MGSGYLGDHEDGGVHREPLFTASSSECQSRPRDPSGSTSTRGRPMCLSSMTLDIRSMTSTTPGASPGNLHGVGSEWMERSAVALDERHAIRHLDLEAVDRLRVQPQIDCLNHIFLDPIVITGHRFDEVGSEKMMPSR